MSSLNQVSLIGYVGRKPELRHTCSGTTVSTFSLASNEAWTDKERRRQDRTEWHRIVTWGRLAEVVCGHLDSGSQVHVLGALRTRQWTDDAGVERWTTEVHAGRVLFLGRKSQPVDISSESVEPPLPEQAPIGAKDEIPF